LNMVTWEQRILAGDPKFEAAQHVPDFAYARYAEMLGLRGIRVERPDAIGPAWDAAFASDRPCVLDVVVDADVAPVPPHITFEQAAALAGAMFKGDEDAAGIVRQAVRSAKAVLGIE